MISSGSYTGESFIFRSLVTALVVMGAVQPESNTLSVPAGFPPFKRVYDLQGR